MLSANERITLRQFQILFVLEAFGTGFVVMPRIAAQTAGQDGWLVALLLVILGVIFAALIAGTAKSFEGEHFVSYTQRLLSKPVSAVICLILWGKIIFCAGLELRLFGEIVRNILLKYTPSWAVYAVVLAIAAYAAAKGIEARARLGEILIVVIAVPLLLLGGIALVNVDFANLLPAMVTPPGDLAYGVLRLGFIFTGLEFIWLVFPYLNNPKGGPKAAVHAMAFAGIIMAVITAFTIANFGPHNTAVLEWPVLKMMDMLNIPGSFIARQEALVLSFWMLSVFAFAAASLFYGAVLGQAQFGQLYKGKHMYWVIFCGLVVFIVAMLPFERKQIYNMLNWIFLVFGIGFWVVLPILLIAVRKIFKSFSKSIVCLAATMFLLTGCWDSVEIENRAFAVAIGIDTAEEARFSFSAALAQPSDEESEEEDSGSSAAQGQTIVEAIKTLDAKSSRKLSFGQTKAIVLSKELLEDKALFREVIGTVESYTEIDRAITVLASDSDISEILTAHPPGESKPGYYVVNFYRLASKSGGRSFHQSFEDMTADLRATGNTLIPLIEEGNVKGALAVKDYQLVGELDETNLRGLLWARDKACEGAVLTAENNTPLVIRRHRSSVRISGNTIIIDVKVRGEIPNFVKEAPSAEEYEQIISREIESVIHKMQQDFEFNGFNLRRPLSSFTGMKVHTLVQCRII